MGDEVVRQTDSKLYYEEEEKVLREWASQAQVKGYLHRIAARKFSRCVSSLCRRQKVFDAVAVDIRRAVFPAV